MRRKYIIHKIGLHHYSNLNFENNYYKEKGANEIKSIHEMFFFSISFQ